MFKKILKKYSIAFIIISLLSMINISYAEVIPVTEENLKSALQKFTQSESNEGSYNIVVENKQINITGEGKTYNIKYDLTLKPTFTMEIPIQKGMSYDKFMEETGSLILPMICYVAVANIQGVEVEDAMSYFMMSYLSGALGEGGFSTEGTYTIVDDLNVSEGVTIEKTDDPKTIYTSEFGDRVIEFVNEMYKEKQTATDANNINSYVYSVERTEVTDSSCKLLATLEVNTDANYSEINGYADRVDDSFTDSSITEETAEIVVNLKVGQKCKIESNEAVTGYELYSQDCVEFSEDKKEFTAKEVGTTNGYLYIGEEKKSIYIKVEENEGNIYVKDYILNLNPIEVPDVLENDTGNEENEENVDTNTDNNTEDDLPKTGADNYILIAIMIVAILVVISKIKLKNINDIE